MNSEELELSLRSEFESHIKTVVADMRQEFSQLQAKVEAEFDKHKSQLDEVFQDFSARLENNRELEGGFAETVIEHLRLARDEGARISATAFAEAEKMEAETTAAPTAGINELSLAISDITAQDSQATILKSLVQHAAQFTPRGAFFIIKNEHFVGWRVFGKEGDSNEQAVREVFFPVASSTALGESVRSLSAVESSFGTYSDDSIYLNKLAFGQPERMYAIPLIARGRGVAVLYADYGTNAEAVNVEALETLVRVAGLTVEVLAAAPAARAAQDFQTASDDYEQSMAGESRAEPVESQIETPKQIQTVSDEQQEKAPAVEKEEYSTEPTSVSDYESVAEAKEVKENYQFTEPTSAQDTPSEAEKGAQFVTPSFEPIEPAVENGYSNGKAETSVAETFEAAVEPAAAQSSVRARFSNRNVDLPIEVGEDERRLHNDARRFARLLVSEIKLYNEQKVREGRQSQDLYERLREAIDRSRDMYDKRVQPPVAAKFDYFHYELVSSLAEGEEGRLGGSYPGAAI